MTAGLILPTGQAVRAASRSGAFEQPTAGQCPGHVQANLIVLPAKYASDFRELCKRNPVSCPLLAESSKPGDVGFDAAVAASTDITTDAPGYNVYNNGVLLHGNVPDIAKYWQSDSIAFLIGCSFTFEDALHKAGLTPRHMSLDVNVAMYRTTTALFPAGVFRGNMVVSMRPYRPEDVEKVRDITRRYSLTHGEPVAWGWDAVARLGIRDVMNPDFGDAPTIEDGEIPVFWGCGVTPQLSVMESPKVTGIVCGHAPGRMVCLDLLVKDLEC